MSSLTHSRCMMSKPPVIIVLLALSTVALVAPASAGLNWAGGGNAPAPLPTRLVYGAGNHAFTTPSIGYNRRGPTVRAAEFRFPTSYPSPVNRYDWSRWFGWMNQGD